MIYTKENLLQMKVEIKGAEALFYEFGELKFCILKYEMIKGLITFPFYAMSRGFEMYTNTGYKSNFGGIGEKVSSEDVNAFIKSEIKNSGLDLDNQNPLLLGSIGKITTFVQPSLF